MINTNPQEFMFQFGIMGYYDEYSQRSYLDCGCIWERGDYHYIAKSCRQSPHPAARVLSSVTVKNQIGQQVTVLVDRAQGEWIKRILRIRPVVQYLEANLRGRKTKLTGFIQKCVVQWLTREFDMKVSDIQEAIQIFHEGLNIKNKAKKDVVRS